MPNPYHSHENGRFTTKSGVGGSSSTGSRKPTPEERQHTVAKAIDTLGNAAML